MKKHMIQTTALDLETGREVPKKSILLDRGKVCYINTTLYKDPFPDRSVFKNLLDSRYSYNNMRMDYISGGGASISRIDTAINNSFIVKKALEELINNSMLGFQFHFVPQNEFTDATGKLNPDVISQKYNPDYIINLKDLTLKVSGDAKVGRSEYRQDFMVFDSGIASSSNTFVNYYGLILMDYTAIWEITDTKKNQRREIQQNGRTISQQHRNYSLYEELMQSAQQIGQDFSLLLSEK